MAISEAAVLLSVKEAMSAIGLSGHHVRRVQCPLSGGMCCKTLCCIASAQQSNPGGRRDESTLRIVV
jgi:hypothetical protein